MEFDWSLYKSTKLSPNEISESFEDPFSLRLLPDSNRFIEQNRFFSLGTSSAGSKIFAVYTSTGKIVRVVAARLMTDEETYFYERKSKETPEMSLAVVSNWDAIPLFANLEEEARFWEGHQIGLSLMHTSLVSTDTNESTTITLRMDPRMLSRLKRLARQRYLNYQSMLKQWVAERLEKELD